MTHRPARSQVFGHVSGPLKRVLDSGIFLGAISAIVLNILLNRDSQFAEHRTTSPALPNSGAGSEVL